MKKYLLILAALFLMVGCSGDTEVEAENTEGDAEEASEENPVLTLINDRALDYGASVQDVEVNKDALNEDEYLVLITFTVLDKKDTEKQYDDLVMYSDDIAAKLSKDYDEINTVVAFWKTVDKKGNILKRAYEKESDGMHLSDEMIEVDYFK